MRWARSSCSRAHRTPGSSVDVRPTLEKYAMNRRLVVMAGVESAIWRAIIAEMELSSVFPFDPGVGDPEPVAFGIALRSAARQRAHQSDVAPVLGCVSQPVIEE